MVSHRGDYEPNRRLVVRRLRSLVTEIGAQGGVLPGEAQLAEKLGVSRTTIRDALTHLEVQGLILRRKGADTLVNTAAADLAARIDLEVDFAEILKDAGYTSAVALLEGGVGKLDEREAELLGAKQGMPAIRTVKRWTADGQVVMVAVDVVPTPDIPASIEFTQPVFDIAMAITGEPIAWEVACPGAVAAAGPIAEWLALPEGKPLWTLERVGLGRTGRRLFLATEYHLPSGVRYGFVRAFHGRRHR
jgi:GntR family transcriptional regulator